MSHDPMQVRKLDHAMLPRLTPEERSRQRAVVALRRLLNARVRPRNVALYESEGEPAFVARHARVPQTPAEIGEAFSLSPGYRLWSAMNRSAQELLWVAVGEPVLRDAARLEAEAERLAASPSRRGSLVLDPSFVPPEPLASTDIHLQPGGYALDRGARDIAAGALYENGGDVYSFGQGIGASDSKAAAVIRRLEATRPGFRPRRVLELGCSAGAASCAYAARWPDAEICAIDVGAGMLRYAHARAEALGAAVHFRQMSATALAFPDASFDLVVSNNLLHEIGRDERRAMLRETFRVLEPGGLAIHQDVPTRYEPTPVRQVERNWDVRYNGEIFWATYSDDDLTADARAAGFAPETIDEQRIEKVSGPGGWYLLTARKVG